MNPFAWLRKAAVFALAIIALVPSLQVARGTQILNVAPGGSDANSGTRQKPMATLEGARDAIRRLKQRGDAPPGGFEVRLAPGTYVRDAVFRLSAEDSGTATLPIRYRAAKEGTVRLLGGKVVTHWTKVSDPAALARLDESARGNVFQADLRALGVSRLGQVDHDRLELFFAGQAMTLARWPNQGFVRIQELVEPNTVDVRGTKGSKTGKFMYAGDRPSRWLKEKEGWVHGYWFWDWADQRQKIESIDVDQQVLSVVPPYHSYGYRKGQWFYALNLLVELDEPGEWYLDRETGLLYFWPPEPLGRGEAIVSVLDTLVTLDQVSHVTFEGLTCEAARGTGMRISQGSQDSVRNCTFRNLGGSGIEVSGGNDHQVVGCHLHGLGEGGISLHGGDRRTLEPGRHLARQNHVHDYGRWKRMYSAAIGIGGVGQRVAQNHIHDAPHQAISFGGNDHVIELNEIHHVCRESNDAGAVYSGRDWTMRGTVIRHNYLHDIDGYEGKGCVGVYLDDMYCGTEIVGNVFYRVTMAAFVGGGRDCLIDNNLFVDCKPAVHIDARALGWAGYHAQEWIEEGRKKGTLSGIAYNQPPYSVRYPALVRILEEDAAAPRGNVVSRNVILGEKWDHIEAKAKPLVTLKDNLDNADPRFVRDPRAVQPSPRATDFELRRDSPAWALGFRPIPLDQIGPPPRRVP